MQAPAVSFIAVYKLRESVYNKGRNMKEGMLMCSREELDIILQEIAGAYRSVYGDNLVKILSFQDLCEIEGNRKRTLG